MQGLVDTGTSLGQTRKEGEAEGWNLESEGMEGI